MSTPLSRLSAQDRTESLPDVRDGVSQKNCCFSPLRLRLCLTDLSVEHSGHADSGNPSAILRHLPYAKAWGDRDVTQMHRPPYPQAPPHQPIGPSYTSTNR